MKRQYSSLTFLSLMFVLVIPGIKILNISSEVIAATKVDFPTKPISLVVPYQAGGGTDVVGRMIADAMEKFLPNKVIVVNKPGGAGIAGIQEVAFAKPDGYTLLFTTGTTIIQTYLTGGRVNYKQFYLLGVVNKDSFTVVVSKNAKWATFDEYLQDAREHPGKIRIGHPGVGTAQYLMVPLLEKAAGVKFQLVPFAGSHPGHVALMGGHIDSTTTMVGDVSPLLKSGDLRMLAVAADNRLREYPEVPTFKEKNVDIGISQWRGIWALREVPEAILDILEEAIRKAANLQSYKDMMTKGGYTPDDIVGRGVLQERLEKEDKIFKEVLTSLKMIKE